ncbi:hypothetical protein F4804DRAFT_317039 [Jackrogersella minutella]|nr:hypothetical protein F4804DRAFT_317039 [Jackrogersella minutella]
MIFKPFYLLISPLLVLYTSVANCAVRIRTHGNILIGKCPPQRASVSVSPELSSRVRLKGTVRRLVRASMTIAWQSTKGKAHGKGADDARRERENAGNNDRSIKHQN